MRSGLEYCAHNTPVFCAQYSSTARGVLEYNERCTAVQSAVYCSTARFVQLEVLGKEEKDDEEDEEGERR